MFGRRKTKTLSPSNQTPANPVRGARHMTGAPAIDPGTIAAAGHVNLSKAAEKVGVSLAKRDLNGMRGRVIVLLDHSRSMYGDFQSGTVQKLLERTLGFGLQVDSSGTVEVIPFDSKVWDTVYVAVRNYPQATAQVWKATQMGSTNLTAALEKVRDIATKTPEPIVCVVLTDGDPNDRRSCTATVVDLARYPVFLKFLALRDVPYLSELDDMDGGRLIDNVDAKTIADPAGISDEDFAEAMVDEWGTWIDAAKAAGVLL
jgi:Mg-chelatase subunit ChlD